MKKTEFKFGEEILVTGEIVRVKERNKRTWKHIEHKPRPALFLNGINLANGTVEYESYGYQGEDGGGYEFSPTELIPGAWICERNRAPRKVFLSDCHKKN